MAPKYFCTSMIQGGAAKYKIATISGTNLDNISSKAFGQSGVIGFDYVETGSSASSLGSMASMGVELQSLINGTWRSETITGTSGDDTIDSAGGSDIIDGGSGTDTLLIYANSSFFTITTLAGLTKIKGSGYSGAGNYAWDMITSKNVEKVQFADKTVTLDTKPNIVILSGRIDKLMPRMLVKLFSP